MARRVRMTKKTTVKKKPMKKPKVRKTTVKVVKTPKADLSKLVPVKKRMKK